MIYRELYDIIIIIRIFNTRPYLAESIVMTKKQISSAEHLLSFAITTLLIAAFCYIGYKMNLSYMLDADEPDWLSFGISLLFVSSCFAALFLLRRFTAVRITLMTFSALTLLGAICFVLEVFKNLGFLTIISILSIYGITKFNFFFAVKPNRVAQLVLLLGFFAAILICSVVLFIVEAQKRKLDRFQPEPV